MLGTLGRGFLEPVASQAAGLGTKGSLIGQKGFFSAQTPRQSGAQWPQQRSQSRLALQAQAVVEADTRSISAGSRRSQQVTEHLQVVPAFPEGSGSLPEVLYRLLDPAAAVELPPAGSVQLRDADNRELDKLVAALGRNKSTWRRAVMLHEWLLEIGYRPDDRLCTTLMRVCAQHGQAATALSLYDWMRTPREEGGGGLTPTVFTYTAAMRAALTGGMMDRALQVWEDAVAAKCEIDCRLCTTLIEVCGRKGDTERALAAYTQMRDAPKDSRMAPSVHAYTAAMRAASEGGRWEAALAIWEDMQKAGCKPTGHAYAAVISACASGGQWQKAVQLFDDMLAWGVRPDVVSCTALITALGTDGQWERAEKVVEWMLRSEIKPNVRTYTALITALGNARQWDRALDIVKRMRRHAFGGLEPNAYTYSALLKTMGEQGKWQMAERFFQELEAEQLSLMAREAAAEVQGAEAASAQRQAAVQQELADAAAFGAAVAGAEDALAASSVAVSAFPGMSKQLPTEAPQASSSREAIAAAAAAVAAMAAARQQQLAGAMPGTAGLLDLDSFGLLAQLQQQQVQQQQGTQAGAAGTPFSYFSGAASAAAAPKPAADTGSPTSVADAAAASASTALSPPAGTQQWTTDNAAVRGLSFHLEDIAPPPPAAVPLGAPANNAVAGSGLRLKPLPKGRGPVNEVVCGALMLAYERAGKWEEAVGMLDRAQRMGIAPNTIMYNTAMSALGKAMRVEAAEAVFARIPSPDAVSHETLIAAYGMSGAADKAEEAFGRMRKSGFAPRDYAYCGLIAAHSFKGDWRAALKVRERMAAAGVPATVHVYNALIAACDRAHQYERAMELAREMGRAGIQPNAVTQTLLEGVCKEGVRAVESQQAAAAALSAAVAAAGTLMIRAGIF